MGAIFTKIPLSRSPLTKPESSVLVRRLSCVNVCHEQVISNVSPQYKHAQDVLITFCVQFFRGGRRFERSAALCLKEGQEQGTRDGE